MRIEIDNNSGFCNGVVRAIRMAEEELQEHGSLHCLGDIVHNTNEVDRLTAQGLVTINLNQFAQLHGQRVLLRAHGEPPSTYHTAENNGITIIDATCPVVLALQCRIREAYLSNPGTQIVLHGKHGHAEVLGLVGQTDNHAIVVDTDEDLEKIDYTKSVMLFSQTTKSIVRFQQIAETIAKRLKDGATLQSFDTICRQVANRLPHISTFAQQYNRILFVGDVKSSNGKMLYEACCNVNENVHFISSTDDIELAWFSPDDSIGICGATSTPKWLMERVAEWLEEKLTKQQ